MNNRSLSPPLLRRNNNNNNNNNNDDVVLEEIQKKLRTDHGMGDFGDSIMRNVVVRSYNNNNNNNNNRPQQQQQDGVEDIDQDEDQDHQLVLSFIVTKDLCNGFNTLHGGASATAVDIFTSVLLHLKYSPNYESNSSTNSSSPSDGASVTSDLHVSCISPAPLGSTVICICQINKSGRGLQFASCDIYKEVTEVIEEEVVVEETKNNSNNNNNNNNTRRRRRRRRKLILVTKGLHTKYVLDKQRQKGFGGSGGRSRSRDGSDGSDGNDGNDGGSGKPLLQRQRQIRSKL